MASALAGTINRKPIRGRSPAGFYRSGFLESPDNSHCAGDAVAEVCGAFLIRRGAVTIGRIATGPL